MSPHAKKHIQMLKILKSMSGLADYGNTENNPICTKGQSLQNVEV